MNEKITPDELKRIRLLEDFDLIMLISEISEYGWADGKILLNDIEAAYAKRRADGNHIEFAAH